MSEQSPEQQGNPENSWTTFRENVTPEMLNETGLGKPIREQYDEKFGEDGWRFEVYPAETVEDELKDASNKIENRLAGEAFTNLLNNEGYTTDGGAEALGIERHPDAPRFGRIVIKTHENNSNEPEA